MSSPSNPPAMSILVVDDTAANLQLLTSMLKGRGYRVRPVTSGELALRAVEAQAPDLVLLDITMPGMDGYEVCRRLKADERWRDIPVLFLSALHETDDKVRAFQAGGVDYIGKPFQFEEVDARVRIHLELRRQKQELKANFARLLELERLRDSLTHMIVHDMRTPLLALQLSVELLREVVPAGDANSTELVETARLGVGQLVEMVAQMLDVSRMEAGKMALTIRRTDLTELARGVLSALKPLAAQRKLGLETPHPAWAECDPDVVRRVIGNFVSNALKFTQETGTVSVAIVVDEPLVRVAVRDDGRGIPPEDHRRIFEKFGQLEHAAKSRGFGLGLTFSKMAVEAHGGRIGVDSRVGEGSTFWFVLPTRQGVQADAG